MVWKYLDLAIVIGYMLLMLGVAFYYYKFARKSLENFFLGGRNVPGWMNGISYAAALVSPDAATGYGGLAIVSGAFISWWYLSRFGLALFFGGVLFAVFWRRLNLFTSLEYYDLRFNKRTAFMMRLWIAFRTSFVAMPAWTGITLLAACKIMEPALNFSRMQTLLLVLPVSFIYVFFSGYKGVVISNVIQMVIFFLGTLTMAILTLNYFGGAETMAGLLEQNFAASHPDILAVVPPAQHDVFPLPAALAWLLGQSIGYGGDAAPMGGAMEGQRILSTRTASEALTMYVVTAISMFILLLLVTLPCISAILLWPELREAHADRELVYGRLMRLLLPSGAMGLMIAAMMAATMSTVADNLNFGSQILVSDGYRKWINKTASDKHYLWMGRLGMLLILGLALLVVFNVNIIIDVAIFMLQLSAAELPANWAQWWWWRFNSAARIAASFGGPVIFCIVVLGPKALLYFNIHGAEQLMLPWWWQTLIVMLATTVLWIAVALFTKPDPYAVLVNFYNRAKPLGWWKPISGSNRIGSIFKGMGIAVVGAASVSLLIVSLSEAWFAMWYRSLALLILSLVLFIIFRSTSRSFINKEI